MTHYSNSYFEWQKDIGKFGGIVNCEKFSDLLVSKPPNFRVLDVGCGGGFLAKHIRDEYLVEVDGFDINPSALASCEANGIRVFSSLGDIPDLSYDLIISNHCLEHVPNPLLFISELKSKLSPNGMLRFYVPLDSYKVSYNKDNIDKHLYSWSPMNLANLFSEAGYDIIEAKPFRHRWPPYYLLIYKLFGNKGFNAVARLYGLLYTKYNQVTITCEFKGQ